ncbi:MAG: LacI family DNA-binding transcriptional regulator [Intrasporangium sp.]|uniref:LacI family DNA-binding transcriptional regulator n=1 Tax=Intrasporangium sp. TaxID=1925024 RepID=UPI003F80594A
MVTIRDVAKAAGVSPSTVSRCFTQPEIVEAATRERVLRIATHLDYRPNRAARGLITGRTGNLGLLLPDLANPFFPSIVKGIQHQAHLSEYQVFVVDTNEDPTVELGLVRSLAKQVDGMILCSPRMRPAELAEAATISPSVLVHRRAGSLPSVTIDNGDAMDQAVDHLAALGHQHIGFVSGPRRSWSGRQRLTGIHKAVAAHGISLDEIGHFAPTFDGGVAAAEGVLLSGVSAVVTYNDLIGLGLLSALRDRGVDVPGDISIVGVDDIPMSAMVQPALTTLSVPKEPSGRLAVDLMLRVLDRPSSRVPPAESLTCQLIVRQTTAPPNPRAAKRTPA